MGGGFSRLVLWFCLSWCDQTDFVVISSEKRLDFFFMRRHLKGVILFHFCVLLVRILLMSFLLKGFSDCIRRGGSLVSAKSLVFLQSPSPLIWFAAALTEFCCGLYINLGVVCQKGVICFRLLASVASIPNFSSCFSLSCLFFSFFFFVPP